MLNAYTYALKIIDEKQIPDGKIFQSHRIPYPETVPSNDNEFVQLGVLFLEYATRHAWGSNTETAAKAYHYLAVLVYNKKYSLSEEKFPQLGLDLDIAASQPVIALFLKSISIDPRLAQAYQNLNALVNANLKSILPNKNLLAKIIKAFEGNSIAHGYLKELLIKSALNDPEELLTLADKVEKISLTKDDFKLFGINDYEESHPSRQTSQLYLAAILKQVPEAYLRLAQGLQTEFSLDPYDYKLLELNSYSRGNYNQSKDILVLAMKQFKYKPIANFPSELYYQIYCELVTLGDLLTDSDCQSIHLNKNTLVSTFYTEAAKYNREHALSYLTKLAFSGIKFNNGDKERFAQRGINIPEDISQGAFLACYLSLVGIKLGYQSFIKHFKHYFSQLSQQGKDKIFIEIMNELPNKNIEECLIYKNYKDALFKTELESTSLRIQQNLYLICMVKAEPELQAYAARRVAHYPEYDHKSFQMSQLQILDSTFNYKSSDFSPRLTLAVVYFYTNMYGVWDGDRYCDYRQGHFYQYFSNNESERRNLTENEWFKLATIMINFLIVNDSQIYTPRLIRMFGDKVKEIKKLFFETLLKMDSQIFPSIGDHQKYLDPNNAFGAFICWSRKDQYVLAQGKTSTGQNFIKEKKFKINPSAIPYKAIDWTSIITQSVPAPKILFEPTKDDIKNIIIPELIKLPVGNLSSKVQDFFRIPDIKHLMVKVVLENVDTFKQHGTSLWDSQNAWGELVCFDQSSKKVIPYNPETKTGTGSSKDIAKKYEPYISTVKTGVGSALANYPGTVINANSLPQKTETSNSAAVTATKKEPKQFVPHTNL